MDWLVGGESKAWIGWWEERARHGLVGGRREQGMDWLVRGESKAWIGCLID